MLSGLHDLTALFHGFELVCRQSCSLRTHRAGAGLYRIASDTRSPLQHQLQQQPECVGLGSVPVYTRDA